VPIDVLEYVEQFSDARRLISRSPSGLHQSLATTDGFRLRRGRPLRAGGDGGWLFFVVG
jgi:hypothetical protein